MIAADAMFKRVALEATWSNKAARMALIGTCLLRFNLIHHNALSIGSIEVSGDKG